MIDAILAVWRVPLGPKVHIEPEQVETFVTAQIADLIRAGYLASGQTLYSRPGKYGGHSGKGLSGGRIEVADQIFDSSTNGWRFWRLDPSEEPRLRDVRAEYSREVLPGEDENEDDNSAEVD